MAPFREKIFFYFAKTKWPDPNAKSGIKAYTDSKTKAPTGVVAILSMPDINLKVPVYKNVGI